MKRCLVFLCLFFRPLTLLGGEPSGEALLQTSQAAYGSLISYIGTTIAKSEFVKDGSLFTQSGTARVIFLSPDRIRIEGKDSAGRAFVIVSDGVRTWVSWEFKNRGAFEEAESLEIAVASFTGVGVGAPAVIPSLLMKLKWGHPFSPRGRFSTVTRETISGVNCYKFSVSDTQRTVTYWIDAKTSLLVQIKEEQDEKQSAEMQQRIEKLMGEALKAKGIPIPKLAISSMESTRSFTTESINDPIDPHLFRDPTKQ